MKKRKVTWLIKSKYGKEKRRHPNASLQQHSQETSDKGQTNGELSVGADVESSTIGGGGCSGRRASGGSTAAGSAGCIGSGLASVGTLDYTAGLLLLKATAVNGSSGLHVEATLDIGKIWQRWAAF